MQREWEWMNGLQSTVGIEKRGDVVRVVVFLTMWFKAKHRCPVPSSVDIIYLVVARNQSNKTKRNETKWISHHSNPDPSCESPTTVLPNRCGIQSMQLHSLTQSILGGLGIAENLCFLRSTLGYGMIRKNEESILHQQKGKRQTNAVNATTSRPWFATIGNTAFFL
mmetsp:Transcript_3631/g.10232  ORF Transcript_3631/g.10232 Transcript_3631/m.10232 type:complete len:166 (-) Transcript_3631:87-584(-)